MTVRVLRQPQDRRKTRRSMACRPCRAVKAAHTRSRGKPRHKTHANLSLAACFRLRVFARGASTPQLQAVMNLFNIRHYEISRAARGAPTIGLPKIRIVAEEKRWIPQVRSRRQPRSQT